jgi:hypothetical protein
MEKSEKHLMAGRAKSTMFDLIARNFNIRTTSQERLKKYYQY